MPHDMEAQGKDLQTSSPRLNPSQPEDGDVSIDQRSTVAKLCKEEGGFAVICETIVTLYQCATSVDPGKVKGEDSGADQIDSGSGGGDVPELEWRILDYGIPVIMGGPDGLEISIFDVKSGDSLRKFCITLASQYQALDDHFHCFASGGESEGNAQTWFAFSFPNVKVSSKVLLAVEHILPHTDSSSSDDIDGMFRLGKRKKKRLAVSQPMGFKHLRHVTKDTETGELTESISIPIEGAHPSDEEARPPDNTLAGASGTESTASFMQCVQVVPRPNSTIEPISHIVTQPADTTTTEIEDKEIDVPQSSTTTTESSLEWLQFDARLPKPPSPVSDQEVLVYQINTFDRGTLRHVKTKTRNMVDSSTFDDPLSMQSLLRAGLDKMKDKLQNIVHLGSVNSVGDEEWPNNDFGGPLFI